MANVVEQVVPANAGLSPAYSAASGGGDKVDVGDTVLLHIKNGDVAPHDCQIVTPGTVDGLAIADLTVTVAAGGAQFVTLKPGPYRGTDGLAQLSWPAGVTGVTFAVLKPKV